MAFFSDIFARDSLVNGHQPSHSLGMLLIDSFGIIEDVNACYCEMYGYVSAELVGESFTKLFQPEKHALLEELHQRFLLEGCELCSGWGALHKEGTPVEVLAKSSRVHDSSGKVYRLVSVLESLSVGPLEPYVLKLLSASPQLKEAVTDFIFISDEQGRCVAVHSPIKELLCAPQDALVGKLHSEVLAADLREVFEHSFRNVNQATPSQCAQVTLMREGRPRQFELRITATQGNTKLSVMREVAPLAIEHEQLHQRAHFDELTQLPNRALLQDRYDQAQAHLRRTGQYCALLFIDLDNFKEINDTYGHDIGDAVLKEVAQRLRSSVRESDTVARYGGDEFVVLLTGLESCVTAAQSHVRQISETVLGALAQPYTLRREPLPAVMQWDDAHRCSASIGTCLITQGVETLRHALCKADGAMFTAKKSGRNAISFGQLSTA